MNLRVMCAAVAFGLTLPAATAAPSKVEPADVDVVDSTGEVVGPLLDFVTGSVTTTLLVDSHVVAAIVTPQYMYNIVGQAVFFALNDCQGQPYTQWPPSTLFDPVAIVTSANSVYAGPKTTPQPLIAHSRLEPGVDACQVGVSNVPYAVPVAFVRNLSPSPFKPPFEIKASKAKK